MEHKRLVALERKRITTAGIAHEFEDGVVKDPESALKRYGVR
jgi:hypothetical protein